MPNKNTMQELQRIVIESRELSEAFDYFFDLTESGTISCKDGKTITPPEFNDELATVLLAVQTRVSHIINKPLTLISPMFFEIQKHHFFHGICFTEEHTYPIVILYFSHVETGIFAMPHQEGTDMCRFILTKQSTYDNIQ
ncbi:MAG TPA: hypothetical protein VNC84_06300 [Gammaproteobacteria bacterium]|jgi:hypothetical protein|nr:hypothetical protein [Gammaproteobacteria bacterium]